MVAVFRTMWLRIAAVIAVVIVVAVGTTIWLRERSPNAEILTVRRGVISEEVIVTGTTKPIQSVELGFESAGRIARVHARVGDHVAAGAVLAELDSSELAADLASASSSLALERAKLSNAELGVGDAERNMRDKLADAYTKADDAVRNRVDQFFSNPRGANPRLNFTAEPSLAYRIENKRMAMESLLTSWSLSLSGSIASDDLTAASAAAKQNLVDIGAFLSDVALALNTLRPSSTLSQTTIDGWRSDVATARTNVNTVASNLTVAEEKLRGAPGGVTQARASVSAAEANVTAARAQFSKTALRAPIAGVVTRQDAKVGEIAPVNTTLVSLLSLQGFEVEANVPEVDIGKIGAGNPVTITLDAFPTEMLAGRVGRIDPAETVVDGVVNYKVSITFDKSDPRIKSGLTANLRIRTIEKQGVLILPQVAIIENDRGTFVRKAEGAERREVPVTLGIRSQDGDVEIVSGLAQGDRVENVGRRNGAHDD